MSIYSFRQRISPFVLIGAAVLIGSAGRLSAGVILPTGLQPGTEYQLIFATSGSIAASSSSISTYNTFASNSGTAASLTSVLPAGVTWHAVVSTGASPNDAKDNAPSFANIPIYNTQGLEVSAGSLYSGTPLLSAIMYDQNGNPVVNDAFTYETWTGSDAFGNVAAAPLGSGNPEFGFASASTTGWITGNTFGSGTPWPIYALSSPITVVPEPAALSLLGAALLAFGGFFFTRRRIKRDSPGIG